MTRNPQFAPTQRQAYDGKGQTVREAVMFPKQGFPVFLFTFLASLSTQAFAGVETEWFGFGEPPTPSPELFAGISAPESSSDSSALPASIEWSVEVNRDLLATQPETIVLNLPDREAVTIARDRSLVRSPGAFLWSGSGNGCSLIVNTLPDEVIATIGCSSGTYRVRTSQSGAHLTRIAYADAPPGAENDVAIATSDVPDGSSAGSLSAITPLLPAIDDHIDVLILYTTTLRQSIENTGGNVQLAMQQLMDETQQAMIDSASAQTSFPLTNVSLVRAQEIVRDETTSIGQDLLFLQTTGPQAIRDYWRADIVMLVRKTPSGGICGLAYIPGYGAPQPAGFAALAVGVAVQVCDFSPYNFQHEFGHLLGANHNPESTQNTTPLEPWAFAHWANPFGKKSGKRTIVSYKVNIPPPNPLVCRGECTQVPNYSNSEVNYMGDWIFHTGLVGERENARVISEVAPFAWDWKLSVGRIFADGFE